MKFKVYGPFEAKIKSNRKKSNGLLDFLIKDNGKCAMKKVIEE